MTNYKDLAGCQFGDWTVLARAPNDKRRQTYWFCRCACGVEKPVGARHLVSGKTNGCGCRKPEISRLLKTTHGMSGTSTYHIWFDMLRRCHDPRVQAYPRYGGSGIHVCERWHTFENFLADMGERPAKLTLDRIDGTKGYSLANCRWASYKQQNRNRKDNRILEMNGRRQSMAAWAEELNIPYPKVQYELARGRTLEEIVNAFWSDK